MASAIRSQGATGRKRPMPGRRDLAYFLFAFDWKFFMNSASMNEPFWCSR